jgi:hypothetical protein
MVATKYTQSSERLKSKLPEKVYQELEAFAAFEAEEKFASIYEILNRRFEKMNELVLEVTELEKSGQDINIQEVQRLFFEIANPKEMHEDLKRAFHFSEISRKYDYFLKEMQDNPYGSLFSKLSLPEQAFTYLDSQILKEAEPVFEELESYTILVKNHFELIRSEKSAKGFKLFVKLMVKGISFAVLGPMGSIGAGLFVNTLFDQKTAIGRSMNDVGNQFDEYEEELKNSLDNMEIAYRYVLMSLYGGALLKVNEALENHYLEIHALNLKRKKYSLKYIEAEEVNTRLWAERQIYMIKRKIAEEKWYEVHAMTDRFYHYVKTNPGMGPVLLTNGRSLGRESFLLKYFVVSKMAEVLKSEGNPGWADYVGNMLEQLPFTVKKEEAKEFGAKLPAEWGMLLVHYTLVNKELATVKAYLDYTYRIVRRILKDWDIPDEERFSENEVDWNIAFGYVLSHFAEDMKLQHPMATYHDEFKLNRPLVKELYSWYLKVAGKDKLSRYLWVLVQIANAALVIAPFVKAGVKIGGLLKSVFRHVGGWLGMNGGKLAKNTLKLASILLLFYGGYQYKDEILEVAASMTAGDAAEGEVFEEDWNDEEASESDGGADFTEETVEESWDEGEETFENDQQDSSASEGSTEEMVVSEDELAGSTEEMLVSEGELAGESEAVVNDAVSEEELADASLPELHIYRLGSAGFQLNGRTFGALLEQQTAPATDTPYSLVITEELPDGMYVYSEEVLHSEPEGIWATRLIEEKSQLLAVTYPGSKNVDVFNVNAEGVIVDKHEVFAELFTAYPDMFTYTDADTMEMRKITIIAGEYVDEVEN